MKLYPFKSLLFTLLFLCFQPIAFSVERIALVIGNANYELEGAVLDNAVNDAMDIAATLETMNFQVILRKDLTKQKIDQAIRNFGDKLQQSGEDTVGLFYYAGHAGEVDGINYIYPVETKFERRDEGAFEGVQVQKLLSKMQIARNKMNVIILDACRNNPYEGKSRSIGSGNNSLAEMRVPVGSIVAYSTASGKQASDGNGRNGLYTQELLHFIKQPGLQIEDIFKKVRRSVREKSGNSQVAWERSSLEGDFYFLPEKEKQLALMQTKLSDQQGETNLSINSNVPGAQILIDEKQVGTSPLSLDNFEEGTVLIKLVKEGFQPAEKKVLLRKSRSITLNFILQQTPMASIMIKTLPDHAEWYLDGVLMGVTPDSLDRIEPGKHKVKILKPGFHSWEKELDLTTASVKNMEVKLEAEKSQTYLEPIKKIATAHVMAGKSIQDKPFSPEVIVISSGEFIMGDQSGKGKENELPVHNVSINKQFAIGKYEVTFAQYDHFSNATGRKKADDFGYGRGQNPVVNVSWEDAIAYTKWLSQQSGHTYRLPSEAEWEYVARAGKKTPRYWSNKIAQLETDTAACNNANIADLSLKAKKPFHKTHQCDDRFPSAAPVGSFKPNIYGIYDLLGNVAEWTGSFYSTPYQGQELRNDEGDVWGKRSIRGGSWSSNPQDVTATARSFQAGAARDLQIGFRVVRELKTDEKLSLN